MHPRPGAAPRPQAPSTRSKLVNLLLLVVALGGAAMLLEQIVVPPEPTLEEKVRARMEDQANLTTSTTTTSVRPKTSEEIDIENLQRFKREGRGGGGGVAPSPSEAPGFSVAGSGTTASGVSGLPYLTPNNVSPALLARAIDFAEASPGDPELREYVANAHVYLSAREVASRRYDDALRYLDGAEQWGASRGDVATVRALVYGHQESWSSAEQWARTALAEGTSEPAEMHHLVGQAQYFREELDRAVASFEKAISIKDDPRYRASLAAAVRDSRSASNYDRKRLSHFIVSYEGETMEMTGRMVLDSLERSYASLVSQFGFEPPEPVVVLLYSRQDYAQMGGPHWSAGYFDGKIRVPVRGLTRVDPRLQATLHHELTHAFVHAEAGRQAPRWLHEGVAQYLDGTDSRRAGQFLAEALRGGGTLENCIRSAMCDVRVFYASASSAVEYIIQQRGMGGIKDLVRALGEGKDMDTAMRDVLGKDQSTFFRDWEHFVRRRFG